MRSTNQNQVATRRYQQIWRLKKRNLAAVTAIFSKLIVLNMIAVSRKFPTACHLQL